MRSKWSLNTLIPTLILGSGIFLLSIYLIVSYAHQKSEYRQSSLQRLELLGPRVADMVETLLSLNENDAVRMELQSVHLMPDIDLIVVLDDSNTVLHARDESMRGQNLESPMLAMAAKLIGAQDASADSGEIVTRIDEHQQLVGMYPFQLPDPDPVGNRPNIGRVIIASNLQASYQAMQMALWSQGLLTALLLAVVAGLAWYVLHRVLTVPLKRVMKTTRAMADGDFTTRTNLASGNELGEIAATLDSLSLSYLEQAGMKSAHERLSYLVDDMVDEFYINNAETLAIIDTNKAARVNLGYSAKELVELRPLSFVMGHTQAGFQAFLEPLLSGRLSHLDCESLHICKDGSTYPVRSHIQYMAQQSPPVLVTISRDLSELRVQEESTRLRERAMAAVSEGIIITDVGKDKRTVVYANKAICELTGYSEKELLGSSIDMLRRNNLHQAALVTMREAFANAESVQVQLDATRKDGSAYVVEVSMSPVFNVSGELTHYIGIHRDVTQKLETEERLHQAQKIKAIGHLSGGLAHDFNNLLSVIVGNLELLRAGTHDKAQLARVAGAENAAHMGAHLTRRLLSFASQQRLVPVVTNVNDHVRNAMALLSPTIGEAIALSEDLAPDLWNTLTDPGEVETAVINLTINARDAMPKGGDIVIRTANIDLDAGGLNVQLDVEPGEYVRLCVMDNGPGISEAMQDRIFEPFFTTKQNQEGSGLGLASVFGFAKQSGGCVSVSSAESKGTVFSVYLPRHVQSADASSKIPGVIDKAEHSFKGIRILVVEDKEMVRQLTIQQLQALGFETLEVENGVDAIALLETGIEVDIVLSDVVMPGGVCGYDVAAWVQAQRPGCHILLTSGFNDPADHRDKVDVTGLQVLQKPYRLDDLRKALHELMEEIRVE